jgi:hypothetical protein
MGLSSHVGSFNITTGALGSTVVVSGMSFQPKVVIFFWEGLTATSNGVRGTARRGIGAAVSASSFFCRSTFDTDAAGTAVAKAGNVTDACVGEINNAGTYVGKADLQSFNSDGFTLEITDAFVTDLLVSYIAYGGSSITNAEIGAFIPSGTAPVNQTVNNTGNFQPNITFFFYSPTPADATLMIGAATSSSAEAVMLTSANDAATSGATGSYCLAGECIAYHVSLAATTSPTTRAEFVSHNASPGGFTINWLERGDAGGVTYLSIKGGNWLVGDFLTQTDTTTAIAASGFGFAPKGVLFMSAGRAATAANAAPSAHSEASIGAATSASARVCRQMASRNGNTAMFVHLAARTDCVYINSDPANAAYTLEGLGDVQTFDSDGFTCIMDDADPTQSFVFYIAAGEVSYSLAGDAGAYTLSGQDAGTRATRKTLGDAGSYSLTGQDATLRWGRKVVADAGAFTLSGQDATLRAARRLSADAGAYVFTGQTANTLVQRVLAASAGSYSLTGQDAGLGRGFIMNAEAGAFTLSGQVVQLLAERTLAASTGAFSLTGQDAGLARGFTLNAETGIYTLNGQGANLIANRLLAAAAGAYSLTGQDTTLSRGRTLFAEAGAYNLSGEAAALLATRLLPAATGAYLLTGQAANFIKGFTLMAEAGTFTLTGSTASLIADRVLAGDTGIFTLSGQAASLLAQRVLAAGTGTFTLTGQDAAVLVDRILAAGTGSFVLTGQDVTLVYSAGEDGSTLLYVLLNSAGTYL